MSDDEKRELQREAADAAINWATGWLTMNALLVAGYALHGALTPEVGRTALLMLPPTGLGMLLGELVHRRLDAGRFRTAVYSTMLAGGLTLLATTA